MLNYVGISRYDQPNFLTNRRRRFYKLYSVQVGGQSKDRFIDPQTEVSVRLEHVPRASSVLRVR